MQKIVAKALLAVSAVGFTPDAPKTFKSGIKSPIYVDNRRLIFAPEQWKTVIEAFQETIRTRNMQLDVIAGIETAGIPHSSVLAYTLGLPSVFVRKKEKEHGTMSKIEGGDVRAKRVLLIEDLVTTGGSSLAGVEALRHEGAVVADCMAIVSYGFAESRTKFNEAQVNLTTLTTLDYIAEAALEAGFFGQQEKAVIDDWLQDPYGWASRHGFDSE